MWVSSSTLAITIHPDSLALLSNQRGQQTLQQGFEKRYERWQNKARKGEKAEFTR
jgi:hypothetical protein